MKAITLRNIPPELARIIERKAREENTSISRAILRLLEENLGTRNKRKNVRFHDLDALGRSWSKEESEVFEKALKDQRRIDPDLWR